MVIKCLEEGGTVPFTVSQHTGYWQLQWGRPDGGGVKFVKGAYI